jgi:Tol biopolymer transport system component
MKFQLWVVGLDGGDPKALTDGKEMAFEAELSPDGKRVAFIVMGDKGKQTADLYVMNLDGTGRKQLTKNGPDQIPATWTADGKRIVFSTLENAGGGPGKGPTGKMFAVGADGEGLKQLAEVSGMFPALSADGKRVMFTELTGAGDFQPRLMVVDVGGKEARELVKGKAMMGRWSPDGKRIVYMGEGEKGQPDVFVMNDDGTGAKPLTKTERHMGFGPRWTADGKRIVFTRMDKGGPDGPGGAVYIMDADGTGEKRITGEGVSAFAGGASLFLISRTERKEFKVDPKAKNP